MEKPLLISATLVNSIRQRLKTETRRTAGLDAINENPDEWRFGGLELSTDGRTYATFYKKNGDSVTSIFPEQIICPYGSVGDSLWIRENWSATNILDHLKPRDLHPTNEQLCIWYMADGEKPQWAGKTRPAIHMPRWMCRLTLDVVEISIERLQDITEEDAQAEGAVRAWETIENKFMIPEPTTEKQVGDFGTYYVGFKAIWVHINGRESWDKNPWVWVIKFKIKTD